MNDIRRILQPLLAEGTGAVILLLVLVAISQALLILPPVIIGHSIDLFARQDPGQVWFWLGLLVVIVALRAIIMPFQARRVTRSIQEATFRFSMDCTRILFSKGYDFFRESNVGGVIKRSERGIAGFEAFLSFLLLLALPASVTMILVAGTMLVIAGWQILLALVLAAIAFVVTSVLVIRWRRPFIDDVNDAEDGLAETYAETYLAAPSIKAAGRIEAAIQSLHGVYRNYADRATRLSFASAVLESSQDLISTLAVAASIGLGILIVASGPGTVTAGDFVVIFSFVATFMSSTRDLMEVRKRHDEFQADIRELDGLLAGPEFRAGLPDKVPGRGDTTITLRPFDVSEGPGLRLDTALRIQPGTRVAVIGETGSGKSSFLELLAGVTTPADTVLIGGDDITEVSYRSVTDIVFYGPQTARFLSGPFARAVLFDPVSRNVPGIAPLLERTRLTSMSSLLDDDDFPVFRLSGGERRRLALLRALVHQRPIIILDEPTGDLDAGVAASVWSAIFDLTRDRILICATHDPDVLDRFDQVLHVSKGVVSARPPDVPGTPSPPSPPS